MAASYTTDLSNINVADSTTGWSEPGTWTAGGTQTPESDYYIQLTSGTIGCVSKSYNATGLGGLVYTAGAGVTIPTDGAYLAWLYHAAPNAIDVLTNGGMRMIVGSATTAFKAWTVGGSDTYAYGGWVNHPVDPAQTADYTVGAPSATLQVFGWAANELAAISKGNPFAIDVIRYGRCEARMNAGDSGTPATFNGFAATNDTVANRWGLISSQSGAYIVKGLVIFGYSSAVYFSDLNKTLFIQNTTKVSANFNAFEIRQATSTVLLTSISISALGTVSRGKWITTDNATVTLTTCTFTDMGTFGFLGNTTARGCTFRRCNLITQSSAALTNCTIDSTNDATRAVLSNNPGNISGTSFISSGTKHAIEADTANGATYYSNGTVTDPQTVWSSDANAYDGSTGTSASCSTAGSTSTNYLQGTGTNAPGTGSTITEVRIRVYGSVTSGDTLSAAIATSTGWTEVLGTASLTSTSAGWGGFTALSTPAGGWTWTKVQGLCTKIYKTGSAGAANAYRVDVAVFTSSYNFTGNTFTGYAATDGTSGNEAFYNNSSGPIILYISGGTPSIRNGTSASTVIVSSVTVTIHVQDVNQTSIQNARVYVTRNSDSSLIIGTSTNYLTDASGNISGGTVSGAGAITISVRKSSSGTTRYIPLVAAGTIGDSNITIPVTITQDIVASA